ncbi:hypothetical protein CY34DRAFT_798236 [Suillus luteus UH-Slu-Lm8-n1]|uniref:Uncharacterized protein n=1 Tax=Suillus luteus UH-Slu-Lm8-n1 TaxID=930992 RepID=A0A0D0BRW6_9AGAM|nr:hypothetical protein CY34DRAFT_798236 [Suillus luteus UH-Slu-Lm8-n1]
MHTGSCVIALDTGSLGDRPFFGTGFRNKFLRMTTTHDSSKQLCSSTLYCIDPFPNITFLSAATLANAASRPKLEDFRPVL